MQSDLKVGTTHVVRIKDLAFGGDGVGRIAGRAVFVPFTIPGERVEIEISVVKDRFARGRLLHVLEASPDRTTPRCPHFARCAGCQYQHVTYEAQLGAKEAQVCALLQRIGGVSDPPVKAIVPSPQPWQYRSRITLHGPGKPAFVGLEHSDRIELDACPIAREELNRALQGWNEAHPDGLPAERDLSIRMDADDRAYCDTGEEKRWLNQMLLSQRFKVPLRSFFQINQSVADQLAEWLLARIQASGCHTLIDAYAGVGVFGLLAAEHVQRVIAIEADEDAVRAGRKNAEKLGVKQIDWLAARVERGLQEVLASVEGRDTICLLDPPRMGCQPEVLKQLMERSVHTILYVSCSPDRLARDIKRLAAADYRLVDVKPFDMFPQTAHIEVVAVLQHEG